MHAGTALTAAEPSTDSALIGRILSGDMRALEALMRRHNRMLYRTARAILGDDAEAEDAVQEAYLRAYQALHSFRGEAKLSTWLVRIVANEALARHRRRARSVTLTPASPTADDEWISSTPGPESEAQRSEMGRMLQMHIDALPDPYRAVFVLRALEELNVEETAAALGIPEVTVRTRYFRARRLLRDWVGNELDGVPDAVFAFAGARCDRIVRKVLGVAVVASAA